MKRFLIALIVALATAPGFAADAVTEAFQKALFEEEANQNLDAAIKGYQEVVARLDEQRKLAATAVFRLGECYRKLGRTNDAVAQYQRLLREFVEQTNLVTLSRQNLAGLNFAAAPPEVAAVSPAAQLEQKRLLEEEIKLAEEQLKGVRQQVQNGVAPRDAQINKEREILRLRRQLVALEPDAGGSAAPGAFRAAPTDEEEKEIRRIQALVKDSPDLINARDAQGQTPLHRAAAAGQMIVAQYLLTNKADMNAATRPSGMVSGARGQTPLHFAAYAGHKSMVELLLTHGVNVNAVNDGGGTPLHVAANRGFKSIVEVLLERGAAVDARAQGVFGFVNVSWSGATPLHLATEGGYAAAVELLLDRGAEVNAQDNGGSTPLHVAARSGFKSVAELLLKHRAEIDAREKNGYTPLAVAVGASQRAVTEFLLENKATVNVTNTVGQTPLLIALGQERPDIGVVDLLLQHGAAVNVQDKEGNSPLGLAVQRKAEDALRLVLARKPNLEIRDRSGTTPLLAAVRDRQTGAVKLLLEAGASPNPPLYDGQTALHWAAMVLDTEAVGLLLAHKADPNITDRGGETPLSRLKRSGYNDAVKAAARDEILQLLLKHGADENLHRRGLIMVGRKSRNWGEPIFYKGTNTANRYTLFELVAEVFSRSQWKDQSAFPDFSRLAIRRLAPQGEQTISVNLEGALNTTDCSADMPLEWGDVVEIPEADHQLNLPWFGPAPDLREVLEKCVQRKVRLVVSGQSKEIQLLPPNLINTAVPMAGSAFPAAVPGSSGQPGKGSANLVLRTFRLRSVVQGSRMLRTSSDQTRVKVTRQDPASGRRYEGLFDLSQSAPGTEHNELWLKDGDVIEVPDKAGAESTGRAAQSKP